MICDTCAARIPAYQSALWANRDMLEKIQAVAGTDLAIHYPSLHKELTELLEARALDPKRMFGATK